MRMHLVIASSLLVAGGASCTDCVTVDGITPRGAWSVGFENIGPDCDVESHVDAVGEVATEGELRLVADGSDGADVSCSVRSADGGYAVTGEVRRGSRSFRVSIAKLAKDASLDHPSTGHVEVVTNRSGAAYGGSCAIYLAVDQVVDDGKVWASFACPTVTGPDESVCAIQRGDFAFELCAGTAPEEDGGDEDE